MNRLGLKLKHLRLKNKKTLRDVEKETGILNAHLSQIESGKIRKPSYDIIKKLEVCYGFDFNDYKSKIHLKLKFNEHIIIEKKDCVFIISFSNCERSHISFMTKSELDDFIDALKYIRLEKEDGDES